MADNTASAPKESWLNWLAITTIFISICATIASFKGGGYSSKAMMSQIQASDLWAQYQSKSIKGYLYDTQADLLTLQAAGLTGPAAQAYQKKIDEYRKAIAHYKTDKEELSAKALALEATRDESQTHGGRFGYSVLFLQLSIMLGALSSIMKKKWLWYISIAIGCFGFVRFLNGFYLWF